MPGGSCFADTNLLLYSFDLRDTAKREKARQWIYRLWRTEKVGSVGRRAWCWMDRAQLSWWDALILPSVERFGCRWLLSRAAGVTKGLPLSIRLSSCRKCTLRSN